MLKFELKKVFARTSNRIALLILLAVVCISCWLACDVFFVNAQGQREYGRAAMQQLRAMQKQWSGVLDEERIKAVIKENRRINATPQAHSEELVQREIAYSWRQGIDGIRELMNCFYRTGFREYNYYRADSLTEKEAGSFYENRVKILKSWLADENDEYVGMLDEKKKEFLVRQYENLSTPLYYDYMLGWSRLFECMKTVVMLMMLVLGYLVAGIFSSEFQYKADSVFYTSLYGRSKAVRAKIAAGFLLVTAIYWTAVLSYSAFVLWFFGADGASCAVQADHNGWKCFYLISNWQKYLLTVIGAYVGCLFISFLVMYVSARTKSSVQAVILPFALILLPSFLENMNNPALNRVVGLLPDRLLQIDSVLNYFDLYELFGKVTGSVWLLLGIYGLLSLILPPLLYREYRHKQME